ncbi:MAG: NAD-dependent epimerase/dehydratase family protein [Cyanobacteria bacterium SBLK]|nr:NAD-dependent epimerase/dehydratase family protein [Cyanobacteria bacterium SBLK]
MKIIVIGGFGFFGKHIAASLKGEGHEVWQLSRVNGYDLNDYSQIEQAFQCFEPDAIYNCAAHVGGLHYVSQRHATIIHDNIQMALNLYKAVGAAVPNALIINPLSNCSYPGEMTFYSESNWLKGEVHSSVYSYGNAKRVLYMLSHCYAIEHGIRTYNLLVPNAFGPGDAIDPNRVHALNGMIIRMIQANRNGQKQFPIWGTGKPIREWIYIDDVAKLMTLALHTPIELIRPLNLAQQWGISIKELAESIAREIGFRGELVFQPEYQDGAPKKIMDARYFRQVFPHYQFTDCDAGIRATVNYYAQVLAEEAFAS